MIVNPTLVNPYEEVSQPTPSITVSSSGLITSSVTYEKGLIQSGTKSSNKQLTTKAATTYTPKTTSQTINSGTYLTGTQTIKGDANLIASNIKSGVSIFGVSGTLESGVTPKTTSIKITNKASFRIRIAYARYSTFYDVAISQPVDYCSMYETSVNANGTTTLSQVIYGRDEAPSKILFYPDEYSNIVVNKFIYYTGSPSTAYVGSSQTSGYTLVSLVGPVTSFTIEYDY